MVSIFQIFWENKYCVPIIQYVLRLLISDVKSLNFDRVVCRSFFNDCSRTTTKSAPFFLFFQQKQIFSVFVSKDRKVARPVLPTFIITNESSYLMIIAQFSVHKRRFKECGRFQRGSIKVLARNTSLYVCFEKKLLNCSSLME